MIATDNFHAGLQSLGFQNVDSEKPFVVFVSELKSNLANLNPYIILELETASYFKANAVFFRYFEDTRPPLPQGYIYDNSENNPGIDYSQIHKELWSSCNIPTFIVIESTKVKIFDCRKPVSIYSDGKIYTKEIAHVDLNDIANYSDTIQRYNAEKFKNGSFWESEEAYHNYLYGKTAYTNLIEKLKILRRSYNENIKISSRLFDYVIIISTLIKFLEENGIDVNGENLASKFFQEEVQCTSFIEILKQNKLVTILEKLGKKFNGGIFELPIEDKIELSKANLSQIINFFDSKLDSKNRFVLWELYSFKHIPVELISNIYEEFLPTEDKGAVYTPKYLVNFLIEECLPLPAQDDFDKNKSSLNRKTIDVSCGSGIFLVNSFKRLVQIYKIKDFYKNNSLPHKVGINALQKILKDNIFGIDINRNAVELTKFSLQLALCQMLSPRQIWTELTFQDLGKENILAQDFFNFIIKERQHNQFALVIGNPPFNPSPIKNGKINNSNYCKAIIAKYSLKVHQIKDHNLALLFLQLSTKLLKDDGLLCLIQPAISLLHNKANYSFRKQLFRENNIPQIIDFSTLRRVLFPTATIPICAVFIQNKKKKNDFINHIVIRRTNPSKERLFFEIDTYDIHSIDNKDAVNNYSWKCNLFGGYRLFNLIKKLNAIKETVRLNKYIDSHAAKNFSLFKNDTNKAYSIFFETKITEGHFPKYITYNTKDNARVLRLIADKNKIDFLKDYFDTYSDLIASYIAGTSSRQGLDRPYDLALEDILNLPIIKMGNFLSISDKILIKDIATYKISEFGQGENAITNKEVQIKNGKLPNELKEFSEIYANALNSVYLIKNKKMVLKEIRSTPGCFIISIEYGENNYYVEELIHDDNFNFTSLLSDKKRKTVLIKKAAIIYSNNSIFIIKPKQLRYWLKSTALLDADTTIADIINLNLFKIND